MIFSCTYIYAFFFIFFSIMFYHRILNIVPSRTLLFIHSLYNSSHLLIPNCQSIPPPVPQDQFLFPAYLFINQVILDKSDIMTLSLSFFNFKIGVRDSPGGAVVKNPPANTGDTGSSPGLGRSHMPRSN